METGRRVFRDAQGLELGKIEIHLHGGFGVRAELKDEFDAVDDQFLTGLADFLGGGD